MKKLLSTILATILCISAFAQISVNGGYLHTTYNVSQSGAAGNVSGNGFYGGVGFEIKLADYSQLSFAPSLNFNLVDCNLGEFGRFSETFYSAPLHIRYTRPIDFTSSLFVSAGPSLICTCESWEFEDFDVAMGVEGGILLSNHLKFMLGYDFGLINQAEGSTYRITRNILHIGVGYKF